MLQVNNLIINYKLKNHPARARTNVQYFCKKKTKFRKFPGMFRLRRIKHISNLDIRSPFRLHFLRLKQDLISLLTKSRHIDHINFCWLEYGIINKHCFICEMTFLIFNRINGLVLSKPKCSCN